MQNKSSTRTAISAGAVAVLVMSAAGGLFSWGMAVGSQDARLFAAAGVAEMAAAAETCGRRAVPVQRDTGYVCMYVNRDGSTLVQTVEDVSARTAALLSHTGSKQ